MKGAWGFKPVEQVNCDRCGCEQCICGDVAFEQWVEEELAAQAADESE